MAIHPFWRGFAGFCRASVLARLTPRKSQATYRWPANFQITDLSKDFWPED
jgi:hypothetical protein